jgi:hypothetical protein
LAHVNGKELEVENQGLLDEVVIDHWLHLEQMDDRKWWMRVGDARLLVLVLEDGRVQVDIERGFYEPALGATRI